MGAAAATAPGRVVRRGTRVPRGAGRNGTAVGTTAAGTRSGVSAAERRDGRQRAPHSDDHRPRGPLTGPPDGGAGGTGRPPQGNAGQAERARCSGGGCPAGRSRTQRPYVRRQITASGLSARQPPYVLPKEHTPPLPGPTRPAGLPAPGRPVRGSCGAGDGGFGGSGRAGRGRGSGRAAGGSRGGAAAGPGARRGADGDGATGREGPIMTRASRAGACTTRGSGAPSGRGAGGTVGVESGAGGRWSVTQPVRAETATAHRSVAVVVVRCTRATLPVPARRRRRTDPGCPARVIPGPGRTDRRPARSPASPGTAHLASTRWRRRRARGPGRRGRCGGRTPRSCACRSTAGCRAAR